MSSTGVTPRTVALPQSRIEMVMDEIRRGILTQQFRPGQPLVEADLAGWLGVSKTPVREALRMLASRGLVSVTPFKGVTVQNVDPDFVRSVYDVRQLVEPEAVRRSVAAGNAGGLARAGAILDEAEAARAQGDFARLTDVNREFHRALYAGCGNELLIEVLDNFRDRASLIGVTGWTLETNRDAEWEEHQAIYAAAAAGEADRASELLRKHLVAFSERMIAHLSNATTTRAGAPASR